MAPTIGLFLRRLDVSTGICIVFLCCAAQAAYGKQHRNSYTNRKKLVNNFIYRLKSVT